MNKRLGLLGMLYLITLCVLWGGAVVAEEQITLRFSDWHLTEDVWRKSLAEGLAQFRALHPTVKIQVEPVTYAKKEKKYIEESEAGKAPDVFHVHAFSLPLFSERAFAKDLTPFLQQEETDFLDAWYSLPLELMTHKGGIYAMPGDYMAMVLFYNAEMFLKAGLDPDIPPKTWDEFLEYAKQLTRDTDGDGRIDQWGFGTVGAKTPGFSLRFGPFLWGFGGEYLTEDLQQSALDSVEAHEAFRFFVELYSKHQVVPPGLTAMNPQEVRMLLAQKKVAMILGSGWTAPIVNQLNPQLHAFEVLRCAPAPMKRIQATSIWLSSWVMSSTTEHPEAAWELIKFLTSREMELKWFVDNGVTSSRRDVSGMAPEILHDKFVSVIASQLPYGKVEPQIEEWPQIMDIITTALQEAIVGITTPDAALAKAHTKINALLAKE